ncbi:MAG: Wzz/FepE/Etk N-terminal domain-containing protein, partial [Calditrichota bacterium]
MSNDHLDTNNHPMNNNHQTNHNHQNLSGGGLEGPQVRTLHDYLRIVYRYRWLVLSVFLLVSAGTVYHTFTKQPIYEASTTIMIQDEKDNMENLFGMPSMTSQKILNNQIEYLKSRTLAQNVIQTLGNGPYADSLYTLETAGSPEANLLQKAVRLPFVVLNRISGNKTESGRPETYEGCIRRLASLLQGKIEVVPVQETDVIRIKYQAPSRQEAVLVANTIAKEYYEQNLNFARGEVNEVKRFLQDQLQTVNDTLFQAEVALKDYQQQTDAIALDQSTEQMVQQ